MIKFAEWLPDQPDIQGGTTEAQNVIPAAAGFRSTQDLAPISGAATDQLRGIFAAKNATGSVTLFAGDNTNLYKFLSADSSLSDISGSSTFSLTGEERWRFVQFGDVVIAAGGVSEDIQKFNLASDSTFSGLSSAAPNANYITVVRDQIWTADIDEGAGRKNNRVRWSGVGVETDWTVGTNQADFQDIFGSGKITGLVGGEYCTILLERGIVRATYVGTPLIYQLDKVESSRGCAFPNSVCNVGNMTFFLSSDGFYSFDGQATRPIGAEKVDRWFFENFQSNNADNMSASVDPSRQLAVWAFPSNSSPDGFSDYLLFYNYALDQWSYAIYSGITTLAPIFTAGYTMESLGNIASTLDAINIALDSSSLKGGEFFFGGGKDKKIQTFTGSTKAALIETNEIPLSVGRHSVVNRIVPYFNEGTVQLQVGTRDLQNEVVSFDTAQSVSADGFSNHRAQGRYHRFRMNLTGDWNFAQGVEVESVALGAR